MIIESEENLCRLDVLVMRQGDFSRQYAQEVIANGEVSVNEKTIIKPGAKFDINSNICITAKKLSFVGRGGLKLEKAVSFFSINLMGKVCGDIGASTGGFTDCMLKYGAKRVYSIDSGTEQLAEKLKNDNRVVSMENQNIRELNGLPEKIEFAAIDVSFVSVLKIICHVMPLLNENGEIVCLVKPQFEAGKTYLNKKGVIKDKKVHVKILQSVIKNFSENKFIVLNITASPIRGQNGNIEYLIYAALNQEYKEKDWTNEIKKIVNESEYI